jgi:protein-tyrosine-phosphatase
VTGQRSRSLEREGNSPESSIGSMRILGLERAHVREVVILPPAAWPRTFTLKELVRRDELMDKRVQGDSLEKWIGRAHAGRLQRDLVGVDTTDDVLDPYGLADHAYDETAAEIDDLVARLVALAWPESIVHERTAADWGR